MRHRRRAGFRKALCASVAFIKPPNAVMHRVVTFERLHICVSAVRTCVGLIEFHPDSLPCIRGGGLNSWSPVPSALRRILSCYRRKSNTYAKDTESLQMRQDAYRVLHNFARIHSAIKQVPAAALGILEKGFSLAELFRIQIISPKPA